MKNQNDVNNTCIIPMKQETIHNLNGFESEFSVYGSLNLTIEEGVINYTIVPTEPWKKAYEEQEIDANLYVDSESRIVFFATVDDGVVGQIILKTNWNQYGFIEDIRIKPEFKGMGIGKALMTKAKSWATERGLGGLTLETQTNNIDACLFYEKCGFVIGGFDRYFYRQIPEVKHEVVLYWYWLNEGDASNSLMKGQER